MDEYFTNGCFDLCMTHTAGFFDYMEQQMKEPFINIIFSKLKEGDKLIHLGKIEQRELPKLGQLEAKLEMTIEEIVRCEHCANYSKDWYHCHFWDWPMHESDHCSKGTKGENYECKEM